jgi:hypothetical protein
MYSGPYLELDQIAALGRFVGRADRLRVRILLEVPDVEGALEQQLDQLEVEPRQLLAQSLVVVVGRRRPQPDQRGRHLEGVVLPGVEVDEGAELRGAGEVDQLDRVVEPHFLDREVDLLGRQRRHDRVAVGRGNHQVEPGARVGGAGELVLELAALGEQLLARRGRRSGDGPADDLLRFLLFGCHGSRKADGSRR